MHKIAGNRDRVGDCLLTGDDLRRGSISYRAFHVVGGLEDFGCQNRTRIKSNVSIGAGDVGDGVGKVDVLGKNVGYDFFFAGCGGFSVFE